jgi:hypothetical protein
LKVLSPPRVIAAGLAAACGVGSFLLPPQAEPWSLPLLATGTAIALAAIWTIDARSIATRARLSAIPLLMFACAYGWLALHATRPEEDVRVSLDLENIERHVVSYRFTFTNLGIQTATIDAVALLEVDAAISDADPSQSLARCLAIPAAELNLDDTSDHRSEQDAGSHYRVYRPLRVSVDHGAFEAMRTIPIGRDGRIAISGIFALDRSHERQFATNVLCPAMRVRDARGATHISVCPGFVMTRQATDTSTDSSWFAPDAEEFRLLPASIAARRPPA